MFRPWGSPVCAQCLPQEAGTTNRIPFLLSFNVFIPTFKGGRKVP